MNAPLVTTDLPSTANPCPSWCSIRAGHPYDSDEHDGRVSRGHEVEIGRVQVGDGVVSVDIAAREIATADDTAAELGQPGIALYGDLNSATADQAVEVSNLLLRAAQRLFVIEREAKS